MIFERKRTLLAGDKFIRDINNLSPEIRDNTIILIGPMGVGKSTIARLLAKNGNRIPLDDRDFLRKIYAHKNKFNNFKNFEFALTGTVLSTLKRPSVIDFGAGHSIYEDEGLRKKMQSICSKFSNVILLLPSDDKEENRKVLMERKRIEQGSPRDHDNWHFITAPDNYELATDTVYEKGKTPEEIANEILEIVKQRKMENIDI